MDIDRDFIALMWTFEILCIIFNPSLQISLTQSYEEPAQAATLSVGQLLTMTVMTVAITMIIVINVTTIRF